MLGLVPTAGDSPPRVALGWLVARGDVSEPNVEWDPPVPGSRVPIGQSHSKEGLGGLGWGRFGAVETRGAGGGASTPSTVARQMGDTPGSAVPPRGRGWLGLVPNRGAAGVGEDGGGDRHSCHGCSLQLLRSPLNGR